MEIKLTKAPAFMDSLAISAAALIPALFADGIVL